MSILGPLQFLLYITNLQVVSDLLDSIMFADKMNLFYWSKDINTVFLKVNNELHKKSINCLYLRNSHFMWKKYLFFDKLSKKDDIPLPLQKLNINNYEIAWTESIKFSGVLVDVNLCWTTLKWNASKIRSQKIAAYYLKLDHFWIKKSLSLYYLYSVT